MNTSQQTLNTQIEIEVQEYEPVWKQILSNLQQSVKISEGQSSMIFRCQTNDQNIIIQKIEKSQNLLQNETSILQQLNHKNIVQYIDSNKGCLLLEYISNGELFNFVTKQKLPENIARYYLHQLVEVLEYCQERDIYHRDIKLDNILLDENFNSKLVDFGFAVQSKEYQRQVMGTEKYLAPEIYMNEQYLPSQTDIFSLGVVLFTMVMGKFPFKKTSSVCELYKFFIKNRQDIYWKNIDKKFQASEQFQNLINQMFCRNPDERITLEQIKQHEWYLQGIPSNEEVKQYMISILQN